MSDALPLTPASRIEEFDQRARELVGICKSGDYDALRAWVAKWIESLVRLYDLDVTLPRTSKELPESEDWM